VLELLQGSLPPLPIQLSSTQISPTTFVYQKAKPFCARTKKISLQKNGQAIMKKLLKIGDPCLVSKYALFSSSNMRKLFSTELSYG
jgi:hypothetical protein